MRSASDRRISRSRWSWAKSSRSIWSIGCIDRVERDLNLGGTLLAHQALLSRQIDLYPEYTGTALAAVLKDSIDTDPAASLRVCASEYLQKFQVEWLDPLGIDDSFAMVVNGPRRARTRTGDAHGCVEGAGAVDARRGLRIRAARGRARRARKNLPACVGRTARRPWIWGCSTKRWSRAR